MARVDTHAFLVIFAVFLSVSFGRPEWTLDNFALLPFAEETAVNGTDGQQNTTHFYISIQSKFRTTSADLCLDVVGDDVVLKDCQKGLESQLWYIQDTKIIHVTGLCLDGCLKDCGYILPQRNVHLFPCHNTYADGKLQKWYTQGKQIKNFYWDTCLDVCHAPKCNPNPDATTYTCHGGANQAWELVLGGYGS